MRRVAGQERRPAVAEREAAGAAARRGRAASRGRRARARRRGRRRAGRRARSGRISRRSPSSAARARAARAARPRPRISRGAATASATRRRAARIGARAGAGAAAGRRSARRGARQRGDRLDHVAVADGQGLGAVGGHRVDGAAGPSAPSRTTPASAQWPSGRSSRSFRSSVVLPRATTTSRGGRVRALARGRSPRGGRTCRAPSSAASRLRTPRLVSSRAAGGLSPGGAAGVSRAARSRCAEEADAGGHRRSASARR